MSSGDDLERSGIRAAANPEDFDAQQDLGLKLLSVERFHEAIRPLEAARILRPQDVILLCNLSTAYSMSGDARQGEAAAVEALRLSGGQVGVFELANALRMGRRFSEAVPLFEEAVRLEPDDIGIRYNLAWSLMGAGRFEEALSNFTQVLEEWPKNPVALELCGQVLVALERYDDAVPLLRRAVEIDVARWNAHDHLGYSLLQLGDYEAGVEAYQAMLAVFPDSIVDVGQNLATALDELDRHVEAERTRASMAEILARRRQP